MRILALSSEFRPYRGGIATYALEMARSAHELGAQVSIAVPDYSTDHAADDRLNYPFRVIRYAGGPHTVRDIPAKLSLVGRLLAEGRYDIVHAMDWPFFLPAAIRARHIDKRLYTIHGTDVVDMAVPYRKLAIRLARTFTGRCEVVANSRYTENLFRDAFRNVDPSLVRHVLLGVGKYWTEPADVTPATRAALGLATDKFVLLTVARVTPRKGQFDVVKALALLPKQLRDRLCYAIVGPGNDKEYLGQIQQEIANADCDVRYLGAVPDDDLRRIYAASDLFCLVGKPIPNGPVEGFGLVFLEAGGQGLPSVAGDFGGVKEVVLHSESGIIVPTGNPDALAAAIGECLNAPERLKQLADGARRRATELSWTKCAALTYGL